MFSWQAQSSSEASSLQLDLRGAISLPGEAAVVVTEEGEQLVERLTIMTYAGIREGDEVTHAFTVRDEKGEISRRSAADLGLLDRSQRVTFYALGGSRQVNARFVS